ncbi:hypothetical protein Pmani_016460 [Petrolisthes manimaculis]|uniref:Uncharacterized protein n=1 Tax=Petrolisthes manimaculis TaxID=1843537 RepID=A0AAE1PP51_9EUCA|nr:hypothetical protein Pmani_016460 [Petrolisthes manimaculis]
MSLSQGVSVLVVLVLGITASSTCLAELLTSSSQDLLSAFSWATLDLPISPEPLMSLEGLNLTTTNMDVMNTANLKPRKKRTLLFQGDKEPPNIELELNFIFPLFNILYADNLNFEVPYLYEIEVPEVVDEEGNFNIGKMGSLALDTMATDFEGLLKRLGVDGGGCVRRALCELATMPPLHPEGIVGEMIDIVLRHLSNSSVVDQFTSNTFNVTKREGEVTTLQEDEMLEGESEDEVLVEEKGEWKKKEDNGEKINEPGKMKDKINSRRQRMMSYLEAGNYGRQNGDCWQAFPQCPVSFFDIFRSQTFDQDSSHDPTESWYNTLRSS